MEVSGPRSILYMYTTVFVHIYTYTGHGVGSRVHFRKVECQGPFLATLLIFDGPKAHGRKKSPPPESCGVGPLIKSPTLNFKPGTLNSKP